MTRHSSLLATSKDYLDRLIPKKVIQSRSHNRIYKQFADTIGLVYFGYVDQRNDEHRLVRGLTVSTKHRDNHYCIGSFDGYDMTLVERVDTIHFPGKSAKTYDWIIMSFDLHQLVDLPHVFLGVHSHDDMFYAQLFTKFSHFSKITFETPAEYATRFLQNYSLYAKPEQALSAERLFTPAIAKTIADSFSELTVEIDDGYLYLYAENHRPTTALLNKMLANGSWLARRIDEQVEARSN